MRALTHADKFLCPHGGPITPKETGAKVTINGQQVLLIKELLGATVGCPAGSGRCNKVRKVANPANFRTKIKVGGKPKQPVMQGATVMTDRGRAMVIPVPGRLSWRLGPAPSYETPGPSVQCIPEKKKKDAVANGLAPGVYLAGRKVKGVPATHQFLLLVPSESSKVDGPESFGKTKGLTLGACRSNRDDCPEHEQGNLVGVENQQNDKAAAKEWLSSEQRGGSHWDASLCHVDVPDGKTVDQFMEDVLRAFEHYQQNVKNAPIEYPLAGGLVARLVEGRCFNSNSWTHGILNVARGESLPDKATDLNGLDLCFDHSIPPYYFRDNQQRIANAKERRTFKPTGSKAAEKLVETAQYLVKTVEGDPAIQNKVEVVLEDLRVILLGGDPTLGSEPLNPDYLRDVRRFTLALNAGAVGVNGESNPIESCLAGLIWGFYAEGFAWLLTDAVVLTYEGKSHPLLFLAASALGKGLAEDPATLRDLPQRLGNIMTSLTR